MSDSDSGETERETRTCLVCGKVLRDGSRFCDRCFDVLVAHCREKSPPSVTV